MNGLKFIKRLSFAAVLIFVSSLLILGQRTECFPFEKLPTEKRRAADELLLKALDSEALYTIAADLKPMSSGFAQVQFDVRVSRDKKKADERQEALRKLEETNEILRYFRCGNNIVAAVQSFARVFDGKRYTEAVVFNQASLNRMVSGKREFFERWGVTPNTHPLQVLAMVENDQTGARFGGYGYLFGYPDYAVRFFVEASAEEEFTGKFVERDFYSIPTFASPNNRFVYAVPKGHVETETDKALKARAVKVFEDYKQRREKYVGDGKRGVVELVRDWLCTADGKCGT